MLKLPARSGASRCVKCPTNRICRVSACRLYSSHAHKHAHARPSCTRVQAVNKSDTERPEDTWAGLTEVEIDDLVDDAASFISVLDKLRTIEGSPFNAFYEVWKRIAAIPPSERFRLLGELEPGSIRLLWKSSMSRYVLDDQRSLELARSSSMRDDFPAEVDKIITYWGKCEKMVYQPSVGLRAVRPKVGARASAPDRPAQWLAPDPGTIELPQDYFKQVFFKVPDSPHVYSRVLLPLLPGIDRWWLPIYNRVNVELTLTPLESDAGADITLVYPAEDSDETRLSSQGVLPYRTWPAPVSKMLSPFSVSGKDYVRPAGPGVYVGCAYRKGKNKDNADENNVYFVLVRKS